MPSTIKFEDYANKYENVAMERHDGILLLRFHTGGEEFVWTLDAHDALPYLFSEIASDKENKVIILTGTGDAFCNKIDFSTFNSRNASEWENVLYEGSRLLNNLLAINVPVISAVNGPARYHPEIPVMSDIVIASNTAVFRDHHYSRGVVPGDGAHVIWTHILGPNRGRYFLFTGQDMDAATALQYGAVNEVVEPKDVLPRAWELAKVIAAKPFLVRRYTREVLTQQFKRLLHDGITVGLALEGLAKMDSLIPPPPPKGQ